MRGICGYGRYDDDPTHVGCPRAKSDMTPCIARDGHLALAQDPDVCVGCGAEPWVLLNEMGRELGMTGRGGFGRRGGEAAQPKHADHLRDLVRQATAPSGTCREPTVTRMSAERSVDRLSAEARRLRAIPVPSPRQRARLFKIEREKLPAAWRAVHQMREGR